MSPDGASSSHLSVGLVLSAGGGVARSFHAGTLAAIAENTGWDPRTADLIVGTSAGAPTAAYLRAGLSAADDYARFTGGDVSDEGRALLTRIRPQTTADAPLSGGRRSTSRRPVRASLALRAGGRQTALVTGLAGLAPAGTWSNHELGDRIRDLGGTEWPTLPTWICAVRLSDGQRVVFGRDDVEVSDLGTAVEASCAVPRVIRPVRIGADRYIDGGTHSSTNADLVAAPAFDVVIIVSSMTTTVPALSYKQPFPRHLGPWWFSRTLQREVAAIRRSGTAVIVIEPTVADLDVRNRDGASQLAVARQAFQSLQTHATEPDNAHAFGLLRDGRGVTAHNTAAHHAPR